MMKMKKILLLGGSAQQIISIETAKRLGLYTILCDFLPDNPGQYHADKFYLESTTDKETILNIAKAESIDYIIAYASDPAAPTAAYVAEKLGLPTNPYRSVEILCNKNLFREFLQEHGFNVPRSRSYTNPETAKSDELDLRFPLIIKPVDSSGSKGATVIHSEKERSEAVDFAFSFSRSNRIIIEEYIEKAHKYLVGGDIFVSDGKIIQWGLMNCHRDSKVNPLVPVGKSFPVALEGKYYEAIKAELQRLITELHITSGPLNVELIVDRDGRVFPIDIGPRSGGNMIPDLLGMIFHCDVVEMSVRAAMGENVQMDNETENLFYATHNIHSDRDGTLEGITFSDEIESYIVSKKIYKEPGDQVQFFDNASKVLGIVFMKFHDMDEMLTILSDINHHIKPVVS